MRLFDFIFNKSCCYPKNLLTEKSIKILIQLLKNIKSMMDQIEEYHDLHKLYEMNQWLYVDEEYDTDALEDDLEDLKQSNYIRKLESIDDTQLLTDFESFHAEYNNNKKDRIEYIQELFEFMVHNLRNKIMDKMEYIYMIKSEYDALPKELKNELENLFDPSVDVTYLNEYEWVIEQDEVVKNQSWITCEWTTIKIRCPDKNVKDPFVFKPFLKFWDNEYHAVALKCVSMPTDAYTKYAISWVEMSTSRCFWKRQI